MKEKAEEGGEKRGEEDTGEGEGGEGIEDREGNRR